MPLLLLILLICPVFSFIVLVINFLAIRLTVAPLEIVAEKRQECSVRLFLQNRFIFPVSPVRIVGDFQSENEHDFSRKVLLTDVPPLSRSIVVLPFKMPFRGEYIVRIYDVYVFDLLKLFRLRRKLELRAKLIILPYEKFPNDSGKETETDLESPATVVTANKSNTFNSLREYREGDSIRHIHWKLTAKQDELVVKQMELSVNNSAVIFNDFSTDTGDDYLTRRMLDATLETSLAITKRILSERNSVINYWQGAMRSERYELSEIAHYSYLYGVFTVLPQKPSPKSFEELIELFSPEIKEHHTIYIVTPSVNREIIRAFEKTGLAARGGVTLITFSAIKASAEAEEYINEKTKIKLIEINDKSQYFDIV
ncbi:MAG: DUF58 domain-containing protein [Oscillospiraceae bacterium]|nr:DUF58 domain-containing protein [Oscillospiraceae bacterium]